MASKPTWADAPFDLIETPSKTMDATSHAAVYCASEMSHAHNVLIRGLNSIYQQGAFITSPKDISDFLFFCSAWVKTVEHHHQAEEKTLFPELEKFTGNPHIMTMNKDQHDEFLGGLTEFEHYAESTRQEQYDWTEAKAQLDGFAPALIRHLREEIGTLLSLKEYNSAKLREVWQKTEDVAKGDIRLPNMFDVILPMVLGCADKTYEGGIHSFPPFPFFFPYLIDYWFIRKNRGAWRFCPCDMHGQPRPLAFTEC
ncbi:hypothetical protein GQ43DRAFT_438040 [Delitschia confertaspora ATCC 74209]|uniref:Hemerythrin-like domain-containing protein n=1 Tax=Delitschia confertaspora ATCC 74209 TaxID=1513339 RepID=A0A9P4JRN3_9PLEO|nr:hypothetical protein GQ43DRAFT_438040 [Delitschia confertaspora ATCC 74209]